MKWTKCNIVQDEYEFIAGLSCIPLRGLHIQRTLCHIWKVAAFGKRGGLDEKRGLPRPRGFQDRRLELEGGRGGVPQPDGARGTVGALSPDQHEAVAEGQRGGAPQRGRQGVCGQEKNWGHMLR